MTAYPIDCFCAKDWRTGAIRVTDNTVCIHHYADTWRKKRLSPWGKVVKLLRGLATRYDCRSAATFLALPCAAKCRGCTPPVVPPVSRPPASPRMPVHNPYVRNFQKNESFPNFLTKKFGNEVIFLALSFEKSSLVNGAEAINGCLGLVLDIGLIITSIRGLQCGKIRHELAEKCKYLLTLESFLFCKSVKKHRSASVDNRPIYCPFSSVSLL